MIVLAWRLTDPLLACLAALSDSEGAPPFEAIVVLNGAADQVRELVNSKVNGATIVDLRENIGFGGGCNAGAAVARGKYTVLLNDDTVVDPRWLHELVASAESNANDGAVASLLLNVDGTVQEAGSRVLRDAGTVQFGKGLPVKNARADGLLVRRQVDYGSGAALLIRTDAFHAVGGMDVFFEPAYFEDVDLCFRLRQAGYGVAFEPRATATHASGGSTNTDPRFREFASSRSGTRFAQRWRSVLDAAPPATAPLSDLCSPASMAIVSSPHGDGRGDSADTALQVARDYHAWLNERLDQTEADLGIERQLRAAEGARLSELEGLVALYHGRLADLDRRSLLGLLKWRVGLRLARARRARQR